MREPRWNRSSYSAEGGNNCVEVAVVPGGVVLRDSKAPGPVVSAGPGAFRALISALCAERPTAPTA